MAQSDNIGPVMLKSGEYVVRKEAVDKLGKNTMDMINNADRLGYMGGGLVPQGENGHSAIDELLALNTLNVQRNTDMTRQSAMMQKGGQIKPIMSKEDSNYSIGVVDELAKALSNFEDMAPLMQIKNSENRKQALSDAQEAGMIMSNEDALNALMQVANSYYRDRADSSNMKGTQSFQNGGYGSMSTQDLQQQYGQFIEDDEERAEFERLFGKPDVSRFLQDRDAFGADARARLMKLQQDTSGSLFKGDTLASRGIIRDYESRTERSLSDTLAREEEDALSYLADAERTGADMTLANPYQQALSNPNAPANPGTNMGETAIGIDGQTYAWNGSNWILQQDTGGFGGATGLGGGG
tara:strand:- start:2249 stop:3310 length:1062 start_codon:yes stop_codon:yes gene_type:complete